MQLYLIMRRLPAYVKFFNRFNFENRFYIGGGLGILFVTSGIIREGVRNGKMLEEREKWHKTQVRHNPMYAYLDEEDPPIPLPNRTGPEQFRAEFAKLTEVRDWR